VVEGSFDRRDMMDTARGDGGFPAEFSDISALVESAGDSSATESSDISGSVESAPLPSGDEEAFGIAL